MPQTTLSELREIRDAQKRADDLRDDLIRKAIKEGHSERKVAIAAGLTQPRINQIVRGTR